MEENVTPTSPVLEEDKPLILHVLVNEKCLSMNNCFTLWCRFI